MPRVCWW
jgi:hypothetical protein